MSITKDDIELIALALARANGHAAPQEYADLVVGHFDHTNEVEHAAPPEPKQEVYEG